MGLILVILRVHQFLWTSLHLEDFNWHAQPASTKAVMWLGSVNYQYSETPRQKAMFAMCAVKKNCLLWGQWGSWWPSMTALILKVILSEKITREHTSNTVQCIYLAVVWCQRPLSWGTHDHDLTLVKIVLTWPQLLRVECSSQSYHGQSLLWRPATLVCMH